MRQVEIRVPKMELKCERCGNNDQERFAVITVPYVCDGRLIGYTLTGVGCMCCDAMMPLGLSEVA